MKTTIICVLFVLMVMVTTGSCLPRGHRVARSLSQSSSQASSYGFGGLGGYGPLGYGLGGYGPLGYGLGGSLYPYPGGYGGYGGNFPSYGGYPYGSQGMYGYGQPLFR